MMETWKTIVHTVTINMNDINYIKLILLIFYYIYIYLFKNILSSTENVEDMLYPLMQKSCMHDFIA